MLHGMMDSAFAGLLVVALKKMNGAPEMAAVVQEQRGVVAEMKQGGLEEVLAVAGEAVRQAIVGKIVMQSHQVVRACIWSCIGSSHLLLNAGKAEPGLY